MFDPSGVLDKSLVQVLPRDQRGAIPALDGASSYERSWPPTSRERHGAPRGVLLARLEHTVPTVGPFETRRRRHRSGPGQPARAIDARATIDRADRALAAAGRAWLFWVVQATRLRGRRRRRSCRHGRG